MSDSIAVWRAEHANFATLLDLLEGQLDLFHQDAKPNYELMLDIMFYMTHYPDVLHHAKEDLAFARIRELDVNVRPIVDELTDAGFSITDVDVFYEDSVPKLFGADSLGTALSP